jgi:hypothetical protein
MKNHTTQILSAEGNEDSSLREPLVANNSNVQSYSAVETTEHGAIITGAATAEDVDNEAVKVIERRTWSWRSQSYKRSLASLIVLLLVFTAIQYVILKTNLPAVDE